MEEKDKHKEEASVSAPFTSAQIVRIRELIQEELAKYEKRKLQEARFGVQMPYPPKEHK